jgi:hypothetical protein
MHTQCPRCAAMLADPGRDFICPRCGARVRSAGGGFVADEEAMGPLASVHMSGEPGWKALLRALQQLARLGAFVLFFVSLLLCFAALFVGIPQVLAGAPGSDLQAVLFILTPAPVGLFGFSGGALAAYHIFLVAAITASVVWLVYRERPEIRPLMSDSAARFRSPDRRSPLGFVQLPQVFLAIFFFDIFFALMLMLTGTTAHAPAFESYPGWYLYYTFANASVYEEFAARVLLLGIPLLLAYILAYNRPAAPAYPAYAAQTPLPYRPAAPPGPAPQRPKTDALVDATVGDATTRLVPRPDGPPPPVASTPAFSAPAPEAPPVQGPGLLYPRVPEKGQALILATAERPVPESMSPGPQGPTSSSPSGPPQHVGEDMGDVTAPYPPPVVMPPGWEPLAPPAPAARPTPPPTLTDYLRSRTTNGLWGYFLGGGFKIGPLEAFFIVGSALMFGLAHVSGWDIWKLTPTFIAGLGFGYLFLKVGIHAAILLHFSFDYLSLGEALLPGFGLMEVVLTLLFTVVGAFYFGHYLAQAVKWLLAQGRPAGGKT